MTSAYQLRPKSRGSIRLAGPDPGAAPLIDPCYLRAEEDRRLVLAGMKRLRAIMRSPPMARSEEHTSELQSLMRISYAVFCLKNKKNNIVRKNQDNPNNTT